VISLVYLITLSSWRSC